MLSPLQNYGAMTLLAVVLAALAGGGTGPLQTQRPQLQRKPIVIVAEMVHGRVVYKVDSKLALPDLLRVLSTLEEQRGRDCPVIALVDVRARISEIGNIDGTAGKAQLTNIRFFMFNEEDGKMTELSFGPTLPFSTNPPID